MTEQGRDARRRFCVIPAVDLLGDEAVRLDQGRFDRVSVQAGDPIALVERFATALPALIHVVDLEGARSGKARPGRLARLVAAAAPVQVQVSGGVRSVSDAEALLATGAARVVVGTAAFASDSVLGELVHALGERLVVAVDVRNGRLAVSGWERASSLDPAAAVDRCAAAGVERLLCSAVERDGTLAGPDVELLALVSERSGRPVLAAGGIRSQADLETLASIGLEGAVVGRALLEGLIPLSALAV
jgi:phosphoribosylformimino-5-aminoimidazole carboxamide ribotide isomerase